MSTHPLLSRVNTEAEPTQFCFSLTDSHGTLQGFLPLPIVQWIFPKIAGKRGAVANIIIYLQQFLNEQVLFTEMLL